jgi:riboflavin biosynthesis pyrimidine reductase
VILLPADPHGRVSLIDLLETLASQGIHSLMVEGGSQVITSFYQERLADQVLLTLAPVFIGGLHAVSPGQPFGESPGQLPTLIESGSQWLEKDLILWGKVQYP